MYKFYDRLRGIYTLDSVRICKILEMLQFSFIFLILIMIVVYILNKFYFPFLENKFQVDKRQSKFKRLIHLFLLALLDTFIIIVIFFYLKRISLIVPSIATIIDEKFKELTTIEYTIHIALVVVLIEMLPKYKERIYELSKLFCSLGPHKISPRKDFNSLNF